MRNYFNEEEKTNHLIAIISMASFDKFKELNCLSDYEKDCLEDAVEALKDFNQSVMKRLGEGYKKSLKNKSMDYEIRLVQKTISQREKSEEDKTNTEYIDGDTISKILDRSIKNDCPYCTKCYGFKDCAIYNMSMIFGYAPKNDGYDNKCPFQSDLPQEEDTEDDLKIFDDGE